MIRKMSLKTWPTTRIARKKNKKKKKKYILERPSFAIPYTGWCIETTGSLNHVCMKSPQKKSR